MTQDELKKQVAQAALDWILPQINEGDVLGIGTGSTANCFIDLLVAHKQRFAAAVSSSQASQQRLEQHGVKVLDLNSVESIKFYVDGADEADPKLALIKGGGAALTQEKIVAAVAQTFVCIVDNSKQVDVLGKFPLPVEVIPMARSYVTREFRKLGGTAIFREGVITDNGGQILDVKGLHIDQPKSTESAINQIPGVITNGLFAHRGADVLFVSSSEGINRIDA